jgi:hypothetical protein
LIPRHISDGFGTFLVFHHIRYLQALYPDYIVVFDDVARSFMQEIRSLVLDFLMNTSNLLLLLTPIT